GGFHTRVLQLRDAETVAAPAAHRFGPVLRYEDRVVGEHAVEVEDDQRHARERGRKLAGHTRSSEIGGASVISVAHLTPNPRTGSHRPPRARAGARGRARTGA